MQQLFILLGDKWLVEIIAKIIDNLLLAGTTDVTEPLISVIAAKLYFGTIVHGLTHLLYFELKIHQHEDFSTVVDCIKYLSVIAKMHLHLLRLRDLSASLLTL